VAGCAGAGLRGTEPRPVTMARARGLWALFRRLPRTLRERGRWRTAAVSRGEVARLIS